MAAKLSGGGGGRYSLNQNSEINVTPFVDILLVLLIIFMVAVPMATVAIKVDLPPATIPPPNAPKPKEPVFISIQKSGALRGDSGQRDVDQAGPARSTGDSRDILGDRQRAAARSSGAEGLCPIRIRQHAA